MSRRLRTLTGTGFTDRDGETDNERAAFQRSEPAYGKVSYASFRRYPSAGPCDRTGAGLCRAAQIGHGWALRGPRHGAVATLRDDALHLALSTSGSLSHLRLRWDGAIPEGLRYLCGAWESSDGDLEWRALVPDRQMPWYFLAYDGQHTHGVGVRTGAAAFCHWQVDPYGVNLWMDVRNGSNPVQPGDRRLRWQRLSRGRGVCGNCRSSPLDVSPARWAVSASCPSNPCTDLRST